MKTFNEALPELSAINVPSSTVSPVDSGKKSKNDEIKNTKPITTHQVHSTKTERERENEKFLELKKELCLSNDEESVDKSDGYERRESITEGTKTVALSTTLKEKHKDSKDSSRARTRTKTVYQNPSLQWAERKKRIRERYSNYRNSRNRSELFKRKLDTENPVVKECKYGKKSNIGNRVPNYSPSETSEISSKNNNPLDKGKSVRLSPKENRKTEIKNSGNKNYDQRHTFKQLVGSEIAEEFSEWKNKEGASLQQTGKHYLELTNNINSTSTSSNNPIQMYKSPFLDSAASSTTVTCNPSCQPTSTYSTLPLNNSYGHAFPYQWNTNSQLGIPTVPYDGIYSNWTRNTCNPINSNMNLAGIETGMNNYNSHGGFTNYPPNQYTYSGISPYPFLRQTHHNYNYTSPFHGNYTYTFPGMEKGYSNSTGKSPLFPQVDNVASGTLNYEYGKLSNSINSASPDANRDINLVATTTVSRSTPTVSQSAATISCDVSDSKTKSISTYCGQQNTVEATSVCDNGICEVEMDVENTLFTDKQCSSTPTQAKRIENSNSIPAGVCDGEECSNNAMEVDDESSVPDKEDIAIDVVDVNSVEQEEIHDQSKSDQKRDDVKSLDLEKSPTLNDLFNQPSPISPIHDEDLQFEESQTIQKTSKVEDKNESHKKQDNSGVAENKSQISSEEKSNVEESPKSKSTLESEKNGAKSSNIKSADC